MRLSLRSLKTTPTLAEGKRNGLSRACGSNARAAGDPIWFQKLDHNLRTCTRTSPNAVGGCVSFIRQTADLLVREMHLLDFLAACKEFPTDVTTK